MTSSAQSVVVVAMYYYTPNTFNHMITRILQFCMMRESSGKILAENCTLKSWILNHRLYKIMTTFPNACRVSTSACHMIKLPPGAVMMAATIRSTKSSTCSKLWAFPSKSCKNSQASQGDPSCKCIMKSVCPTGEQPRSWSVSLSHSLCNKNHGVTNSSTTFSLLEVKEIKDIISERCSFSSSTTTFILPCLPCTNKQTQEKIAIVFSILEEESIAALKQELSC